jgi:hypothetical protein
MLGPGQASMEPSLGRKICPSDLGTIAKSEVACKIIGFISIMAGLADITPLLEDQFCLKAAAVGAKTPIFS